MVAELPEDFQQRVSCSCVAVKQPPSYEGKQLKLYIRGNAANEMIGATMRLSGGGLPADNVCFGALQVQIIALITRFHFSTRTSPRILFCMHHLPLLAVVLCAGDKR